MASEILATANSGGKITTARFKSTTANVGVMQQSVRAFSDLIASVFDLLRLMRQAFARVSETQHEKWPAALEAASMFFSPTMRERMDGNALEVEATGDDSERETCGCLSIS